MGFSFSEPTATHPSAESVETQDTAQENTDVTTDTVTDTAGGTDEGNGGESGAENTGGEAAGDDGAAAEEAPPAESEQPSSEPAAEVEYFYGDEAVGVEIDPTHREAFEEKGLDIDALAAELYSKDGGFKLSDESYKKCCDAFGKFAIDALLSGLKAQNEHTLNNWKMEKEASAKADAERFTTLCAEVGGEEGWGRLEEFALQTLSDDELNAFNEVMASGNKYLQQYALKELEGRRKAVQGDDSVNLIEGNAAPTSSGDNSPLNARDYIKATAALGSQFPHDKAGYAKAQAQLDARRRAGQAAGL